MIGAHLKATAGFVRHFFRPSEQVVAITANGHRQMEGWDWCPEEEIVALAKQQSRGSKKRPLLGLYCFEGPHRSELIFLREKVEILGNGADCSVVLTPDEKCPEPRARYRFLINGKASITGEGGALLTMNGVAESGAELLDYDELSLLGNRFLVLMLGQGREST